MENIYNIHKPKWDYRMSFGIEKGVYFTWVGQVAHILV